MPKAMERNIMEIVLTQDLHGDYKMHDSLASGSLLNR